MMKDPALTAQCCKAILAAISEARQTFPLGVSVKCRIGVDEYDSYEFLHHFIDTVSKTGVSKFQVQGLISDAQLIILL